MNKKYREKYEKTRDIKNNDKNKKYILKGQRNANYYVKILSKSKENHKINFIYNK